MAPHNGFPPRFSPSPGTLRTSRTISTMRSWSRWRAGACGWSTETVWGPSRAPAVTGKAWSQTIGRSRTRPCTTRFAISDSARSMPKKPLARVRGAVLRLWGSAIVRLLVVGWTAQAIAEEVRRLHHERIRHSQPNQYDRTEEG